jgi:hypothetical protein
MLNELQPDLRELLNLVREVERYDATLTASRMYGNPIEVGPGADEERHRKENRIQEIRAKWNL